MYDLCVYVYVYVCMDVSDCVYVCLATNGQSKWENREHFHVLNIIKAICLKQGLSVRLARLASHTQSNTARWFHFKNQRSTGLRRERV